MDVSLAAQTAYADLLDRAAAAAFERDFVDEGNFVAKERRGRRYWYFERKTDEGYHQKYVGVETPDLLQRIRRHKHVRDNARDRQRVVASLVRQNLLPRPVHEMAQLLAALSHAGVFRLGAVLVGTTAYQTYSAMLGRRLPKAALQTGDVDVAQARDISIAVGDRTPPMLEVLKEVDPSFREVPKLSAKHATSYVARGGLRVDVVAQDYLIEDSVPAVLLHGTGIHVRVPAPARYALHKLIVARRRPEGNVKREKDLLQAKELLHILAERRQNELKAAWEDCWARGPKWRTLLTEGLARIDAAVRDGVLLCVGQPRSILPGVALKIGPSRLRHDFDSDTITFLAEDAGRAVRCAIGRTALDDHFKPEERDKEGRLRVVREHREQIERLMTLKYLRLPIEHIGAVLITTRDMQELLRLDRAGGR